MNKNLLTFIFLLLSGVAVAQYAGLPSLAGSSTTSDGGSSGSEYWFDAGAGFIATNATVAGLAVTDAGMIIQGVALFVTDGGTRSDIQMRTGSTIQGTLRASANTVAGHIVGLNMSLPSGKSFSIYTEASSGTTTVFRDYGTAEFNQSSGNSAIQFNSSGARLDFGPTSSLDYIASDATGIGTAGYFKFGAYTDAGLPAAAAGNLGATAYGSSTGGLKLSNGVTWIDIGASGGGSSVNYWYDGGVMSLNGSSRGTIFTDSFIRNPDAGASLSVTGSTAGVAIGTALHITNNVDGQSVGSAIAFGVGDVNPTQAVSWTFASSASNGGINAGTNNQSNSPFHWSIGAGAPGTATTRVQSITGSAINGYFPFTSQVASTVNGFECATTGCRIDTGPGTDNYFVGDGTGIETPGYLEIGGYTQGATGFCTGTACAGTAFASFPAAAGVSSRLLYDATNQAYRASDGTNWQTVAYEQSVAGFLPLGVATAAIVPVQEVQIKNAAKVTAIHVIPIQAGTGGGNMVATVYNLSSATALCSVTFGPCTSVGSTSATTNCTGVVAKNDSIVLRIDSTGCTTSPSVNIIATIVGG